MKKISPFFVILLSVSLAAVFQPLRAEAVTDSMEFTYAGNPVGAGAFSEDSYRGGAILLTKEVTERFDGCRITEVIIANGKFCDQESAPLEIFFTRDLKETPFYSMSDEMDIDHPMEFKSYPLGKAVEIHAEEPFFVGFVTWASGVSAPSYGMSYPVYTDNNIHTDLPGGYTAFSRSIGVPEKMEWEDDGYSSGQICMRLKIEGDRMPHNVAELTLYEFSGYIAPESPAVAVFQIINRGVNPIMDVDMSYTVFGKTTSAHFDLIEGHEYNQYIHLPLRWTVSEEGVNVPVKFSIEKVNGEAPSSSATTTYDLTVHSIRLDNGFDRKMLVEEAGGKGCGWCVRGIVGLDHMFKKYGQDAFIPISAHSPGYGDATSPFGYDAFWERFITHNPSCLVNRNISGHGITDPNNVTLENIYSQVTATRAIAEIDIRKCVVENGWLNAESEVRFAFPEEDASYSVAYVVTEDGVGPYPQSNAYSGSGIEMDGWETLPAVVSTYYDFLARGISNFDGTSLDVGGSIVAGKTYSHSDDVYLVKVTDLNRIAVIAMLINNRTGIVENAVRKQINEINSVEEISVGDAPLEYYDLSGRRISGRPDSGVYILRQGAKTRKMVVGSN